MRLDEYVSIDNKIARSVNLERDVDNIEQIRRFQITPMVQRMLGRFADALEGEPARLVIDRPLWKRQIGVLQLSPGIVFESCRFHP